jgi:hypothetical protein
VESEAKANHGPTGTVNGGCGCLILLALLGGLLLHGFAAYETIQDFVVLYSLSSRGHSAMAKVVSSERKFSHAGGGKTTPRLYIWHEYELEYHGYRGRWSDILHTTGFDYPAPPYSSDRYPTRPLPSGTEIPVLYLDSDPSTVTKGRHGDSTWALFIASHGLGDLCFLAPWLALAVLGVFVAVSSVVVALGRVVSALGGLLRRSWFVPTNGARGL